jgi:hypothetical protein
MSSTAQSASTGLVSWVSERRMGRMGRTARALAWAPWPLHHLFLLALVPLRPKQREKAHRSLRRPSWAIMGPSWGMPHPNSRLGDPVQSLRPSLKHTPRCQEPCDDRHACMGAMLWRLLTHSRRPSRRLSLVSPAIHTRFAPLSSLIPLSLFYEVRPGHSSH